MGGWNKKDIIGQVSGRLTALDNGIPFVSCKCECGVIKTIRRNAFMQGVTRSCGCLARDTFLESFQTHGMYKERIYHIWSGMKSRCYRPKCNGYSSYGGKGIKVCEKWQSFIGFYEDMEEGYEEHLTLDRLDNDKDYCKSNCKWATYGEQARNKKGVVNITIDGVTLCIMDWINLYPYITKSMAYKRNLRGELGYHFLRYSGCPISPTEDYPDIIKPSVMINKEI